MLAGKFDDREPTIREVTQPPGEAVAKQAPPREQVIGRAAGVCKVRVNREVRAMMMEPVECIRLYTLPPSSLSQGRVYADPRRAWKTRSMDVR
jgi:hypothetical protein